MRARRRPDVKPPTVDSIVGGLTLVEERRSEMAASLVDGNLELALRQSFALTRLTSWLSDEIADACRISRRRT